jgi:SAM-dependent methyltransferase
VSPASFHRRRLIRRLIAKHAPLAHRVLDAGAGPGQLVAELSLHFPGARVAAADVSPRSLELTRARCPNAETFLLDLASSGFLVEQAGRLGSFDLVVCSEVLEHLADDALGLQRLRELLEPGGYLVVTVPGGKMSRFDVAIGHQRHYGLRELERRLEQNGFSVVTAMAWGFPFQNLYRSAVRVASRAALPGGSPGRSATPNRALEAGYAAFGKLLLPLFFFNLPWLGEQLVAVARKRSP